MIWKAIERNIGNATDKVPSGIWLHFAKLFIQIPLVLTLPFFIAEFVVLVLPRVRTVLSRPIVL